MQNEFGFNVIYCDIPREVSLLRDLKSLFRLAKIFRRNGYDIVHSHTPKAGLITALAAVLALRRVRLHTFTGQRWVTITGPLRRLLKFLDKIIVKLNTCCYADSPSQVEFLIQEKIAGSNEIKCLGVGSFGGVDSRICPTEDRDYLRAEISRTHGIPNDGVWMLFVGRVVRDKGVNELVKAHEIALAKKQHRLIFVGPFEEKLDPIDLETKNAIVNDKSIHYLGFQKNPAYFMAAADFLCLPSYREGFGSVVIEAAACGIPTIGADIPGLRDAIVNSETGVLVPCKDAQKLADAISALVSDEKLRVRMGAAARKRACEQFEYRVLSQLQIEEYLTLLNQY
ncbi:MAG: glycosyltransferase family 4 protein [Bdellovibrionaceae bacterium]|nr:glycosyltransferase family 4 protein [Pseudobdellovibrionaceae bacterium]